MIDTPGTTDPRPQLGSAPDQVQRQVGALGPSDLCASTPCGDYDVETLVAHVVAVLRKLATVGRGEDMTTVTDPADDVAKRGAAELLLARAELESVWATDATLDKLTQWPGAP